MAVTVPVEFLAKFEKSLQGFDDFSKQIGKKVDSVESKFSSLGNVLKIAAGAFAVKKLIDGLQAVVSEAAEAEEVVNGMSNALKASGDFSEQNVRSFEALADELSRTTRFSDDVILSQVKIAKQFGLTNKEAAKLIRTATDLAEVTGQDLDTVTRQLGQTFDGTAGRLAQLFPELQKLTAEELRNGAAVDILGQKYEGFASGALNTFNGQIGQLSKNFNEVLETLGSSIVNNNAVIDLVKLLNSLFEDFREALDANKDSLREFVTGGILVAVQAFGILAQVLKQFNSLAKGAAAIFSTSLDSFNKKLDRIVQDEKIFDSLSQGAADFAEKIERGRVRSDAAAKSIGEIKTGFDKLQPSVQRFDQSIRTDFETLEKSLKGVGETQIATLKNVYEANVEIINRAKKNGFITDERAVKTLGNLTLKYEKEAAEARKKSYDEVVSKVKEIANNPIQFLFGSSGRGQNPDGTFGSGRFSQRAQEGLAAGGGLLTNVLGGAEGARKFIGAAASAAGVAFFGPAGEAFGPLVETLSKGPEETRKMIREFAQALPDLIQAVIESIPVVIEEILVQLPNIIDRLIDKTPEIIEALIESIPRILPALIALTPKIATALVRGIGRLIGKSGLDFASNVLKGAVNFVGEILRGAGKFVEKLVKEIGKGLGGITGGGSSGGIGGIIGGITNVIGGIKLPKIPKLFKTGGTDIGPVPTSPFQKAGGPSQIAVSVQVSRSELATAIVDLGRLGYRLEPG